MALNDVIFFEESSKYWGDKLMDNTNDVWKLALITNAVVPTASDATPTLGDYTECSAGGGYSANGETIANQAWAESGGTSTFDADDVTWTKTAGSPTDIYYALLYNSSAGNRALLAVDMGGPASMVAGNVSVSWNASGIMRHINQ